MYLVDQSKRSFAQIYLQKNACCIKLQLPILFFVKSIISDMHQGITSCISIFSKIGLVDDQSKQCAQIYLQKIASCINLQLPIVFFFLN